MAVKQKKVGVLSFKDISSKYCKGEELKALSEQFLGDVLRVTGYEEDREGYIVDASEDPIEPRYLLVKGKPLRHANAGVLHQRDLIFDPYNNPIIMEELFKEYLNDFYDQVVSTQIYAHNTKELPKGDTYGYITILFNDGSKIVTFNHWKDCTKYLEAFMRMEGMCDEMVKDVLQPYDEYENEMVKKYGKVRQ